MNKGGGDRILLPSQKNPRKFGARKGLKQVQRQKKGWPAEMSRFQVLRAALPGPTPTPPPFRKPKTQNKFGWEGGGGGVDICHGKKFQGP